MRGGRIAMAVGALGCGPTVEVGSSDASTSGDASSSTTSTDVTGADAVTTAVADTSSTTTTSESTTGEPIEPSCEMPGSCDETCEQWEALVESANGSWIERVAIAPDGTLFAIEVRQTAGSEPVVSLLRGFDMGGDPLFEEALLAEDPDIPLSVTELAISAAGTIAIVTAEKLDEQSYRASLDVRASDGTPYWSSELAPDESMVGGAIAFGGDDSLVVGGIRNEGLAWAGILVAYSPEGQFRWRRDSDELEIDYGGVVAIAPSSPTEFVLAGADIGGLWLARIDHDGTVLWTTEVPGDNEISHAATDIAVSPEGELLVVGIESDGPGYPLPWFGRFSSDGSSIASVAYEEIASGPHGLYSIEVTDNGRIFVAGIRVNESGGTSRHVLELACDGTVAWEWTHANPKGYDYANSGGLAWSSTTGLAVGGSDYVGEDFTRRGFLALLVP